ncbi:MAG: GspH/FimT family protein [Burkholderiaceae bacterium]
MPGRHRPEARGFTLIELAAVLAIAAILVRFAAPDLSRTASAGALRSQASEFMSTLRFARSEAVRRGGVVTVCAADASAAAPRCRGSGAVDWRGGWLVFVDRGTRGALGNGDQLLRVQPPLALSGGVAGTRGTLSFTAAGYCTDAASRYEFDPPGSAVAPPLLVCVSKQGRARLADQGICA